MFQNSSASQKSNIIAKGARCSSAEPLCCDDVTEAMTKTGLKAKWPDSIGVPDPQLATAACCQPALCSDDPAEAEPGPLMKCSSWGAAERDATFPPVRWNHTNACVHSVAIYRSVSHCLSFSVCRLPSSAWTFH